MKQKEVTYEVKGPLWITLPSALGCVGILVVMALDNEYTLANLWESNHWVGIGAFLFCVTILPVLTLMGLFTKTVFTKTEIVHRNFMLLETRKRYEDITAVEVTKRADIRLHFVDGTSIKVLTGEWYLLKTLQVLEVHVSPDLLPKRC